MIAGYKYMAKYKERLPIYLKEDLKAQIKQEADEDGRSLNNYIMFILERRSQIEEVKYIQDRIK